jgi:hypothetical protein
MFNLVIQIYVVRLVRGEGYLRQVTYQADASGNSSVPIRATYLSIINYTVIGDVQPDQADQTLSLLTSYDPSSKPCVLSYAGGDPDLASSQCFKSHWRSSVPAID